MKDVTQEILDIMNAPANMAGDVAREIGNLIRDNPGVSAGLIVGYTRSRMAGDSHSKTLVDLGINAIAGKAIEEVIKWIGKKIS